MQPTLPKQTQEHALQVPGSLSQKTGGMCHLRVWASALMACVCALCACVVCAEQVLLLGVLAVQLHSVRDRGQGQLQHEERGLLSIVSAAIVLNISSSWTLSQQTPGRDVQHCEHMATWHRTCTVKKACVHPAGGRHVAG